LHTPPSTISRGLPFEELVGRIWDREPDPEPKIRTDPVTICIASISQFGHEGNFYPMIVGATDRMLTASDIQFEPSQTKVVLLNSRIVVLIAGDASFQSSVCMDAYNELQDETEVTVKRAATVYSEAFGRYRREQAELKYLSPLGLNLESFVQTTKNFSQETIDNLIYKLEHNRVGAEAIIAGIDPDKTAHIYTVKDPGKIDCQNAVGFAAIGAGEWHAQSLFMFNKYSRLRSFSEALFLTYAAKKRAEVAPGVGDETDMFILDTSATDVNFTYAPILEPLMEKLGNTYTEYTVGLKGILDTSLKDTDQYINEIVNQNTQANNPDNQDDPTVN